MREAVVLVVALAACRTERVPERPADVAVARVDAGGPAPAAEEKEAGVSGNGWIVGAEQLDPKYVERAIVLQTMRGAAHLDLLAFDEAVEECSSMGGTHAFFTATTSGVVHFGGHGAPLQAAFTTKGELWVAALDVLDAPESVKNDKWCVPDRRIDARAVAMVPVASKEEGEALLRSLRRR